MKAHASWWNVFAGRITARDRAGNDLADKEAKKALSEAKRSAPIGAFSGHLSRALAWTNWMRRYAEDWKEDTTMGQEQAEEWGAQNEAEATRGEKARATMTHERWEERGSVACRRRGRREEGTSGGRRPLDDACLGSAGGRALAHTTGNKNFVWREFKHTEAEFVRGGATLMQKSRVPAGMVDEERKEEEAAVEGGGEEMRGDGGFVQAWMRDPSWMQQPNLWIMQGKAGEAGQEQGSKGGVHCVRADSSGHLLRKTGAMVWCVKCARFAQSRLGKGLKEKCVAE